MTAEKILYTDGHEVTVTDSFFKVRKSMYYLEGITRHRLFVVYPDRLVPFMVMLWGAVLTTLGTLRQIPSNVIPDVEFRSYLISANLLAIVLGGVMGLAGLVVMTLMRERYAIRIATAEGEKNVVVSPRREYITQILDALNHAFFEMVSSPGKTKKQSKLNRKES